MPAAAIEEAGPAPAAPAAASGAAAEPSPPVTEPTEAGIHFDKFDDKAFLAARKSGAPVVLYFEADWCAPCREMHATTLREPSVAHAAAGVRFFRVDMSKPDSYVDLVQKSFRVTGAPTVIFFGPGGKESTRTFGFISAKEFVKMLEASRAPAGS
jgi:thiol:disulfide interchange protein DsbD